MQFRIIILTIITFTLLFVLLFLVLENNSAILTESITDGISNRQQAYILPISQPAAPIRNWGISDPSVDGKAAIIYDLKSNQILFDKNLDRRLPIASVTKVLSAVVVLENMDLDREIIVPKSALNTDGEGAELFESERLTVDQLLHLMLIESNNDAASTLAIRAGFDFVEEMNRVANRIGMNSSQFYDPAGFDDRGFSTVSDLINLIKYAIKYNYLWEIMSTRETSIVSTEGIVHNIKSTNELFDEINGIVGGKTGYTDLALGNLLLVIRDDLSTFATIILGSNQRFSDSRILYNWAREAYSFR